MHPALLLLLITIFNISQVSAAPLSLDDARHLLNRTGFGASPAKLTSLIGKSRSEAIDIITDGLSSRTTNPMPLWTQQFAPHHSIRNELGKVERRKFNEAREQEIRSLRQWWVREMIETASPQTERLVLFWHNHFASGYSGINDQAISIARQHETIRQHATGNFREFLKAIIRDPAMLNYLDNDNSKKIAPNENLARELLELFTLGEGNYQESDIKNVARALTGYGINRYSNMQFVFTPYQHDNEEKEIFGQSGKFDGDDVVDLILQQPAAARFIAKKFWHAMISHETPATDQIDKLANAFRDANYEITALYRAVLNSDAFWDKKYRAGLIRSPVSLTIGTIRSTGVVPVNWQTLSTELKALGQDLFEPPNVAGWPGGKSWVTPSRLLNRLEWLKAFDSSCADCTNEMITTTGMMRATAPATQLMNASSADARGRTLMVTMASEEFDEPVRYRITLFADDTILWTSGETTLPGGRDTKRFGRAQGEKNLPWRDVHFDLPAAARRFDSIEIDYLNDKQTKGADRNLYIRHAVFQNRLYKANSGVQTNSCPNRKRSNGGVMLCNGKLVLNKKAKTEKTTSKAPETGTLTASGVYLRSVQSPKRKNRSAIQFQLTDVSIDRNQWHTITANFHHVKKTDKYELVLLQKNCWPDCFERWPQCGSNKTADKRWSLTIEPGYKQQCSYKNLASTDKHLVDALITLAPDFYKLSENAQKLSRQNVFNSYTGWAPYIDSIKHTVASMDINTVSKLSIAQSAEPAEGMNNMAGAISPMPLANGRTLQEYQQDFSALIEASAAKDLSNILLPSESEPVAGGSLTDILSSLTYQLQ